MSNQNYYCFLAFVSIYSKPVPALRLLYFKQERVFRLEASGLDSGSEHIEGAFD